MSLAMTQTERDAFLADVHIGIISISRAGRSPLAVPVWYAYTPDGEVHIVTGETSRKARLLKATSSFSLCTQTETPPYRYVSVEGTVVAIEPADLERDVRPMAHRYLGAELGDRYIEATTEEREREGTVLVRMRPDRWFSADYAKQFGAS